jgi:CRISPR-associated protein Cas1
MEVRQNTLYVMTQGAYVRRDHLTVQVEVEGKVRLGVPLHNLEAVVLFGQVMASPGLLAGCAENGVAVTFLSEAGRLLARVDAPGSGNVLLRREQFRWADQPVRALSLGKTFVAGKLQNARNSLLRSAREDNRNGQTLRAAAEAQAAGIRRLEDAESLDAVRGIEGAAAKVYFAALPAFLKVEGDAFAMKGRTRRPPLDRINALLSFCYALLLADCVAALVGAGLDPSVGFLHADRPGKPSLALDLMEEFRPLIADRLVITLINRKQVQPDGFLPREGGAVEMTEATRKEVVTAWRDRKKDQVTHQLLQQSMLIGDLPHIQAKILARQIRGDIDQYVPCTLK